MLVFEKTCKAIVSVEAIWHLYEEVDEWPRWDKSLSAAELSGKFAVGSEGVMRMMNGMSVPFTIVECSRAKSFSTKAQMGQISVTVQHSLEQKGNEVLVTHRLLLEGGEPEMMKGMGEQLSGGFDESLRGLCALALEQ